MLKYRADSLDNHLGNLTRGVRRNQAPVLLQGQKSTRVSREKREGIPDVHDEPAIKKPHSHGAKYCGIVTF